MNQGAHEMYYQQQMSAGQQQAPHNVTAYSHHQQTPIMQAGSTYPAPPQQYAAYPNYTNGLTSPPQGPPQISGIPNQNVLPLPGVGSQTPVPGGYQGGFDTTGQVAPPNMKPRVTATLWEDEGSLCFQVEARGICVARREDNHMINGTKLLNVAGMTRGRRDGILKSEKVRHVVKIGPMHLKGVWIPFDRALDFANKEKITELLYPLFVHNIGALLYHPSNQNRSSQVLAAQERRKQEVQHSQMSTHAQRTGSQQAGAPLPSMHHHSMSLGSQPSMATHPSMAPRPALDRAHTFPTPPTSANSVMPGGMGGQDNYQQQWSQQGMSNGQSNNAMGIDAGMAGNVARSMPATPATTPPGPNVQNMHASYPPVSQAYDGSRTLYNPSSTQQASNTQQSNAYPPMNGTDNRGMYSHTGYMKNEMGPPSSRPVGGHADTKTANGDGFAGQGEQTSHAPNEEEAEHEHDGEYTHDNNVYDATRNSYYNNGTPAVGTLSGEHQHQVTEINGSPHPPASGRATPRTAQPPQTYYPNQQGYSTPPQPQPSSRGLDYSDGRGQANGTSGGEHYAPQPDLHGSLPNGYPSQPSMTTGASGGMKRGRDEEDESSELKRRKTLTGYDMINRPMAAIPSGQRISR
ncbi:hypothetical protein DL546_009660 [Coniochaeta pulveracea]|uniref:HTH APSES-type domain-containing protein n=1 Tax=Coniochaeta pulveracea TaxID=177199 RepID=A0A420YP22_9PEZI|nr:hypothetical protein DL546_009660 [Coniochaeta pulveracea]